MYFFAFGVRDADRLLRRNKSTVQRGRKTSGHRMAGNGALAPTSEALGGGGPGASSRV